MKKALVFFLIAALLLSAIGLTVAETGETSEPEIEKPVRIEVVDETGEAVSGAELRLSDAHGQVLKAWDSGTSGKTLFLKEGAYSVEAVDMPAGYLDNAETAQLDVELTAEETVTDYVGAVAYDHDHPGICNNKKHVGLELYTVGPDHTVAFCINHGLKNPTENSRYKMLVATPEVLFDHALNKSDDITAQELYDHVMAIMYHGEAVGAKYGFDDALTRYLTYMAIKKYTDAKAFNTYDDNGNAVTDGSGTPLGSIINHARWEKHPLEAGFAEAYQELVGYTDHPDDYILYLYYPDNFNGDNAFQCLLSVKQVKTKTVTLHVRAAAQFEITLQWKDANSSAHRPAVSAIVSKLKLYANGKDVTKLYKSGLEVIDNHDNTYTVRFNTLPRRNDRMKDIAYKLRISAIAGYRASTNYVTNGETIVFTANITAFKPLR